MTAMLRLVPFLSLALIAKSANASEIPAPAHAPVPYLAHHYGAGVATGIVVVPASLALATWLGTTSSNLIAAALPALLLVAILPPTAMTFAQWWTGNWLEESSATIHPAIWVAAGVHLAIVTGAVLLGANTRNFGEATAFVAVDALVVPAAITLTMHWSRPKGGGGTVSPAPNRPMTTSDDALDPLAPVAFSLPVLTVVF